MRDEACWCRGEHTIKFNGHQIRGKIKSLGKDEEHLVGYAAACDSDQYNEAHITALSQICVGSRIDMKRKVDDDNGGNTYISNGATPSWACPRSRRLQLSLHRLLADLQTM